MQIITDFMVVIVVTVAASFLLLAKLHRQFSHMIEGRLYQEQSKKLPPKFHASYKPCAKEVYLNIATFSLLGVAVGLAVHPESPMFLTYTVAGFAVLLFFLTARVTMQNFSKEEARNRIELEFQKRP
jgi:hypothetical protein